MNSVVPAAESIHGIYLYGIVLVGHGRLPKVIRISLSIVISCREMLYFYEISFCFLIDAVS